MAEPLIADAGFPEVELPNAIAVFFHNCGQCIVGEIGPIDADAEVLDRAPQAQKSARHLHKVRVTARGPDLGAASSFQPG